MEKLADCVQQPLRFDNIVVIGHSNVHGIRIASDHFASWDEFANWLAIFEPNRIALLACEAGRLLPVETLFDKLKGLREILATPFLAHKLAMLPIGGALAYLARANRPNRDLVDLGTLLFSVVSKTGPVLRWTRKDRRTGKLKLWDQFARYSRPQTDQNRYKRSPSSTTQPSAW